jgi:hypothetical protein
MHRKIHLSFELRYMAAGISLEAQFRQMHTLRTQAIET